MLHVSARIKRIIIYSSTEALQISFCFRLIQLSPILRKSLSVGESFLFIITAYRFEKKKLVKQRTVTAFFQNKNINEQAAFILVLACSTHIGHIVRSTSCDNYYQSHQHNDISTNHSNTMINYDQQSRDCDCVQEIQEVT